MVKEEQYDGQNPALIDGPDDYYIETIKQNGVYEIPPDSNFMAMREVRIDVHVPTNMENVNDDVELVPGGIIVSGDLDNNEETQDTEYMITSGQRTTILESTSNITIQRTTIDTYQSTQSLNQIISDEEGVITNFNNI